uniref:E2F transcription factor CC-MB domain-containing protein n=1 Tax=Paramormyrops kingsleyae TaxID=1676925 RepID=A0A3B3T3Z4_9TELE
MRTSATPLTVRDNLLAVIAPSGTQLEVPMPEMGHNGQKKYQVNLRSSSAPIHVLLINRETSSSKPVVFSVPPPDDISAVPTPPDTPASLPKSSVDLRTPSDRKVSLADPQLTSAPDTMPIIRRSSVQIPESAEQFHLWGVCDLFDVQILNY